MMKDVIDKIDQVELLGEICAGTGRLPAEIVSQQEVTFLVRSLLEHPGLARADGVLGAGLHDGLEEVLKVRQRHFTLPRLVL